MKITAMVEVNPSKLAMWRAAIALAHSDKQLSNSEIDLIWTNSENFDFTEEQRRQLETDFRDGVALDDVWPQITDKLDRAHLINFALVLFHIDGDFSSVEQQLWEEINNRHMITIDLRGAMKDAQQSTEQFLKEDRQKLDADYQSESRILKAFHYLTFWND